MLGSLAKVSFFLFVITVTGDAASALADRTIVEFSMDEHQVRMRGNSFTTGTCEYAPTDTERPFYERLDEAARRTVWSKPGETNEPSKFTLKGHVGQFVSWLGIVRRIDLSAESKGGRLLIENKYFVGSTDCNIQTVEITGGGDFEVDLEKMPDGLIPLVLVRVYGEVVAETDRRPRIKPEYVRLWHFGQFKFNDLFGEDHGNPEWKRRMSLTKGEDVDLMRLSREYYEQLLGPTKEEWEKILAWHHAQTELEASDDPYDPHERTVAYEALKREQRYLDRLPPKDRVTVKDKLGETEHADFELRGHIHEFVSWFGIVREATPYVTRPGGTLLLENKYFKGSGDERLLTVSIRGGGDFKAELTHFGEDLEPLKLVRVYGNVIREDNKLPVIQATYVRIWDPGQYAFDDYGVDRANARWTKDRQLKPGDQIFTSDVTADYYIKRLGPTPKQAERIRDLLKWKAEEEKSEPAKVSPTETTTATPSPAP